MFKYIKNVNPIWYSSAQKLEKALNIDRIFRIETFDNSHLFGTFYVAGMVVFDNFLPNKNLYRKFKIDSSIKSGVVVRGLENSSSAAKAGIQKGDVITKINDDNVTSTAFLRYLLYKYNVGDTIKVTINRNGTVKTVEVKLTAKD